MTLIVPVCCVYAPVLPRAVISTQQAALHVNTCARTHTVYRAHMPVLYHREESEYVLIVYEPDQL